MKPATRPGTVVCDVADPYRHGIVRKLLLQEGTTQFVADVHWLDGPSSRVRIADLRRVTSETPRKPDRSATVKPPRAFEPHTGTPEFGHHDGAAVRFSSDTGEIWCCFKRGSRYGPWYEPSRPAQMLCYDVAVLSEAEYHRLHPNVPPLPDEAFRDGWRSPLI